MRVSDKLHLTSLLQESAKPTDDNSPPIYRWVPSQAEDLNESVKRTTDDKRNDKERFSRPLRGLD